ncbi:Lrp/AsnC family transcriptional regulator [Candidatus Woesearchaeota archaeon]|nr:MAG: Lrp/AsnC family transcriptional regulator [Candidatus Woesearchaeota archaeon]
MATHTDLDHTDEQLLARLRLNSRQSIKQIARQLRISKDVARYRIKRLEERGIIRRYMAHLDFSALGYQSYRTFLKLQHTTPDIQQKIYNSIKKIPGMRIMGRLEGEWNLGWVTIARSPYAYSQIFDDFLKEYSEYIQRKEICLIIEQKRYFYHLPGKYGSFGTFERSNPQPYDKKDAALLKKLVANARAPLITLAQELKLSPKTVRERTKRLQKCGIIGNFGIDLNLDLTYYKLMVNLEDVRKLPRIYSFAEQHHAYVGAIFRTLGGADVEIDIFSPSFKQFLALIDALKQTLPEDIKNYSYVTISQLHIPEHLDIEPPATLK